MLNELRRELRPALVGLAALTVLTGVLYPLLVTVFAQVLFPGRANGSLVVRDGKVVGSELIEQPFEQPGHFWGRPSATGPFACNAGVSSGSNLGPSSPALLQAVADRIARLRAADPGNDAPVPLDLVTASGSGLDPHIGVAATLYQVRRVARATGRTESELKDLVQAHVEPRQFGVLGEPRVNVLLLNMALDAGAPGKRK